MAAEASKQVIRPGQYKDLTRAELAKAEVTCIRMDKMLGNYEIWVLGKMVKEVTAQQMLINPRAHVEAYAEVFGMDPDSIDIGA